MTNKQIAEKIEAAGHQVPAGLNRAKLEALAAEKGVPLEDATTGEGSVTSAPTDGEYDPMRLITPQEACSYFEGDPTAE